MKKLIVLVTLLLTTSLFAITQKTKDLVETILLDYPHLNTTIKDSLIDLIDKLVTRGSKSEVDRKFTNSIIKLTIPEILFCNYNIRDSKKVYYYPIIKELSLGQKITRAIKLSITQKISLKYQNLDFNEEGVEGSLISFISILINNTEFRNWDHMLYNLNCMAAALVYDSKEYSNKASLNLGIAFKGIKKQLENQYFSCITFTNIVIFLIDHLGLKEKLIFTKSTGNAKHSYIKTLSGVLDHQKIYIDPYSFYLEFNKYRKEFKNMVVLNKLGEDGNPKNYFGVLAKKFQPPGIAYEVSKQKFLGAFYEGQKLPKEKCNLQFNIGKVNLFFQKDANNACEGKIFSFQWKNPKTKKRQAKLFTLLQNNGELKAIVLPSPKSYGVETSTFIGGLNESFPEWLKFYFPKINQRMPFQFISIESTQQFREAEVGDYSEYYKNQNPKGADQSVDLVP